MFSVWSVKYKGLFIVIMSAYQGSNYQLFSSEELPSSIAPLLENVFMKKGLLSKKVGSAKLEESDYHPISPKTSAPQYANPWNERRERENSRDKKGASYKANKKALALLLKPASTTLSNTGSPRSFHGGTDRGLKVLWYCEVLQ